MKPYRASALAAALILAIAGPQAWAAEPPEGLRTVRVAAQDLTAAGLPSAAVQDYGSFAWMELSSSELRRLEDSGVPFTVVADAGQVRLPGHRFDPLVEGEPPLAPELRAPAASTGFHLVQVRGRRAAPGSPPWRPRASRSSSTTRTRPISSGEAPSS